MQSDPICLSHDLILRAKTLPHVRLSHAHAAVRGLLRHHLPISAAILLAYATAHDHRSSLLLFHQSPLKRSSAFLHNALLRALSISSLHHDSLAVYNQMFRNNIRPDDRTFPFALTACTAAGSVLKGLELHASLIRCGFQRDPFVGNTLISFYGSWTIVDALNVFDEMTHRDIVSWNSIISVSSANGLFMEAMSWFVELTRTGLPVNLVSLVSALAACADVDFGKGVHGYAVKVGLDVNVTVGNALGDMYAKCDNSDASMRFFHSMPDRNDVSWNTIIGGLVHVGRYADALRMFRSMMSDEVKLNSITMASLLPALVELGFLQFGREVHAYCVKTGMDDDVFVGNSLVDMYAKFRLAKEAAKVFYGMRNKNVVSWNAMIANFAQNGAELESIRLVGDMMVCGECPNSVTFTNVLPACARIASLKKGKEIHARSIRAMSHIELFVSNALIDMYAKCRRLDLARNVFDVSQRDQVSYNTLIVGYSETQWCSKAMVLFAEMASVGLEHDSVSFMGALSACANLPSLKQGKEIHGLSVMKNLSNHLFVANSILEMYIKCGKLEMARKIFDGISNKDVASWNTMILGYGMQGELETAVSLFDLMKEEHVEYDHVSYIAALSACSHGGMIERGKRYFNQMLVDNIRATQMHYACMVDLFGRAGLMEEAAEFIRGMPFQADSNVWGALLGACRIHNNIDLGRWAADHLFDLKPGHSGYYVLLKNMYAEAGRWEEANAIRELMRSRSVDKSPGCSWVETGNKMPAFAIGEKVDSLEMDLRLAQPG